MSEPAIRVEGVGKRFGDTVALADVSLSVPRGAFLVLLGGSGSGKTTLLRLLAGLETPDAGRIAFDGRTVADGARGSVVPPAKRGIGMVFQSYALWPHMTVAGNIDWPLKVAGWSSHDRRARVDEVLRLVGIETLASRSPAQLSGGQQQRVAIARAIASRPALLLLDEPLSALDAKLRGELRLELARLHASTGATSVHVTHDQVEALTLASHVAVLEHGRLVQFGTPADLVERPATASVAALVGLPPGNLVPVERHDGALRFAGIEISRHGPSLATQAFYRPEALRVVPPDTPGSLVGEVIETAPYGGRAVLTVETVGRRLTLLHDVGEARGARLHIAFPPEAAAWFDANGNRIDTVCA